MTAGNGTPETGRTMTAALAEAATTAGLAPSVHNTQPWRWRVLPDRLELHVETDRRLPATDPDNRLLILSCGTALHHARTALTAEGWTAHVVRMPDPADPDLLAVVAGAEPAPASAEAMRLVQCMRVRHTDRRPVSDQAVPDGTLLEIAAATEAEGIRLHLLDSHQVLDLAAAASRAESAEADDPQVLAELAYWTGRTGPAGAGITTEVLPDRPAETTVPGRDFGRAGTLPIGSGHDHAARYAVLYGDDDEPASWLHAGEGLSAGWLAATRLGVSLVPLSGVVEVASTRAALRQALDHLGYPYLVLRLGIADPDHAGPPHTPRIPAAQVIDTTGVRER